MMRSCSTISVSGRAAAPFRPAPRPGAWRSAAALPPRRRLLPPPAAEAASPQQQSAFGQLVASGAKPTKTAVGKLSVGDLRAECERLALPADGLKAALVDRLLAWWEAQAGQPGQQVAPPAQQAAAEAAPAVAPPSINGSGAELREAEAQPVRLQEAQPQRQAQAQRQERRPGEQQGEGQQAPRVSVTWLGTSSGNPTSKRNVSAIAVHFDEDVYMVDAGEGTRHQMRRCRSGPMDPARVRGIFVTHMHGDHCFGVGGLIAAVCQARLGTPLQHEPLRIFGPKELQSLVAFALRAGGVALTTPVIVTGFVLDPAKARPPTKVDTAGMLQFELQAPDGVERLPPEVAGTLPALQEAYDAGSEDIVQPGLAWSLAIPGGLRVSAAQLQHRVPCWGYVFQEGHARAAAPPAAQAAEDDEQAAGGAAGGAAGAEQASLGQAAAQEVDLAGQLKAAQQAAAQQQEWVRRGRKLVVLGDTCDSRAIAPLAMGCDLLSHEATFCSGMEGKADVAQHSTTRMAGAFARQVAARQLVLTHFSARYESVSGHAQILKRERQDMRKAEARAMAAEGGGIAEELRRLWEETRETYGRSTIKLASDFFVVNVPPPKPVPLPELQQEEAALQQAGAEAMQRAAAPRGRPQYSQRQQYGQREQRQRQQRPRQEGRPPFRQDRRPGGGRQQWQRRPDGRPPQQRWSDDRPQQQRQQRAGGGPPSYREQQQWPPRDQE